MRLAECNDLEVFVLGTAGPIDHGDYTKMIFDNSKGMFALLAMLKTVADHYKHASIEGFKNSSSISCGLLAKIYDCGQ
ncbi:hypothetical protein CU097_008234 [Rhizopus azygosporus]|uniref:Uncharacterized protein n=1 Tax=Rhizopus azygosporus TaxID=86630 RepID=A0A367JWT0_RHIAZ|nr:hypothetical protein CU097_008234 [Rhizopus azygosporus]